MPAERSATCRSDGTKQPNRLPLDAGGFLIHADNCEGLTYLLEEAKLGGRVRLVYIDPPFGTNQSFTFSSQRSATVSRPKGGRIAFADTLTGDQYLKFLEKRLCLIRKLMAEDGSIYLHTDTKTGHYVKCLMDRIFGHEHFLNDITRIKCNPKNFARGGYGNVKDTVLFYSKSRRYVWNEPRHALDVEKDPRFQCVAPDGRRYTTTPLHAPGETRNGATGGPWRGMPPPPGRHWRYPPEVLDDLDRRGRIEWSSTGNPRKIIYADEVARKGAKVQDVWKFKDPQKPVYPTEKNLRMLRMIVRASSNEGDWVLDAFCGSGTTLVAARELGRRFIGIDISSEAIRLASERLGGCAAIRLSRTSCA